MKSSVFIECLSKILMSFTSFNTARKVFFTRSRSVSRERGNHDQPLVVFLIQAMRTSSDNFVNLSLSLFVSLQQQQMPPLPAVYQYNVMRIQVWMMHIEIFKMPTLAVILLMITRQLFQPVGIAFQEQLAHNLSRLLFFIRVHVARVILVISMGHYHQHLVR
jgi:hypothetical protein